MTSSTADMKTIYANGVEFHYFEAGAGPLALCLHGFPDTAHSWLPVMKHIANAGFRVVAPNMRGYAPTSVPADGFYQTAALSIDAIALHEAFGAGGDAVIIGHDWGAPATYGAALHSPSRWRKVVGMAVPPGPALGAAFMGNLQQLKRSWYMFFFQHGLADMIVPSNNHAFIDMLWNDWSPGFNSAVAAQHVKDALASPANMAAALGYYRATLGDGVKDPSLDLLQGRMGGESPSQPLLYLHGRNDGCIGAEVAELAGSMTGSNVKIEIIENAGHFLQLEQPDVVGNRIAEWIAQ